MSLQTKKLLLDLAKRQYFKIFKIFYLSPKSIREHPNLAIRWDKGKNIRD